MSDRADQEEAVRRNARRWLFLLPAALAIAALAWTALQPTWVCTSRSDTIICTDYSGMKVVVATGSVGLALVLAALVGVATCLPRSAIAVGLVLGIALIGLGVASYIRVLT